jgi:hypothetical protein
MSQTVADVLVSVLDQTGVKQIFGLIGDSLESDSRRAPLSGSPAPTFLHPSSSSTTAPISASQRISSRSPWASSEMHDRLSV